MLQRGNAYHMGSHAGAWEPGKNDHLKCKPENEGCRNKYDKSLKLTAWIFFVDPITEKREGEKK